MKREQVLDLLATVQNARCETEDIEVKAAARGTPQRLYESLSAFANRPGGGFLLLGVDEAREFQVVGVRDPQHTQEEISQLASDGMEPPLRLGFGLAQVESRPVIAVEVPEIPVLQRPCYYKKAGLQSGAYIRVGNTNRQMTDYEIFGYVTSRQQPVHDEEVVGGATLEDLDQDMLDGYLSRLRRTRPEAFFLKQPPEQVLRHLHVILDDGDVPRPTLAALLMFGRYPQAFEPQLFITFLQYYGTTEDELTPAGGRFLDNRRFEGPIPQMLENTVNYVMAGVRKSSLIDGLWRRDIPEYPEEALREAIANAIAHRDYSHYARGSYIQIRLFADRLEIQSPGGLYGTVTEDTLEDEQSTRNRVLMRLMEDAHLVENRGSGIRAMIAAMGRLNLEPPRFRDRRSSFWVTFRSHTLMSPEAIGWLNRFGGLALNDRQRLALVYLRANERLTNSDYRRLNHVDTVVANKELRSLTRTGLVEQRGAKRGAYYTLAVTEELPGVLAGSQRAEAVLSYVRRHGAIANQECRTLLDVNVTQASRLLSAMVKAGLLHREGERRWARYKLA